MCDQVTRNAPSSLGQFRRTSIIQCGDALTITRRGLLTTAISAGVVSGVAATTLPGLSRASSYDRSYLTDVISPENMNPVFEWTDIMLRAIRDREIPPPIAARIIAMGHVAGFSAVNGVHRQYADTFGFGWAPQGTNALAAYHTAMDIALSEAFQISFYPQRKRLLSRMSNTANKTLGIEWGRRVGKRMVRARATDGSEASKINYYTGSYRLRRHVGHWEPTLPNFGAGLGPQIPSYHRPLFPGYGDITPWIMGDKRRFRAPAFPSFSSKQFADEYEEVRILGASDSTTRTADETEIALFWEDGPRGATPPGHWLIIAMQLCQGRFSVYEMARIMAQVSIGQADAAIAAWDSKYHYDILRPENAIRYRAHELGNRDPRVRRQAGWTSLINTPPFPTYTSGHSCFSGAGARAIALALGTDKVSFSRFPTDLVNWPQLKGVTRHFNSIWQAAEENGQSRIYGGVHWQIDNRIALDVGRAIADTTANHTFQRRFG
jgi:hypothetical protein